MMISLLQKTMFLIQKKTFSHDKKELYKLKKVLIKKKHFSSLIHTIGIPINIKINYLYFLLKKSCS
jgi:hypothetical protein